MPRPTVRRRPAPVVLGLGLSVIAAMALAAPGAVAAGTRPLPPGAATRIAAAAARRQAAQPRALASREEGGHDEGEDPDEIADSAAQYADARIAPGTDLPAAALPAARADAARLPVSGGPWRELTSQPYQAEPAGYTDPVESNAGAGFDLVSGRMTALATDGGTTYAGAADGGVWRSSNGGRTWTPLFQDQATASIGALWVDSRHQLWIGTGEANTNSDSYQGQGVYLSGDGGRTVRKVGGAELDGAQVFRLASDGRGGVYAATTRGLWRHSAAGTGGGWSLLLKPDPNPGGSPYLTSFITDVAVRPGTGGRTVVAALGWRGGTPYNGFYVSADGGATFTKAAPTGDIDGSDIGRTTFAYSGDGSALYAIVQSPAKLNAGDDTVLQGVFRAAGGNPAGPWTLIADATKLGASGSALENLDGYHVGVQAWYNQALAVDPTDPKHVYVSLEEVFETTDAGATFTTASPYWNYGLPAGLPKTTHPDQHALAISGGQVWIGNDGGVYRRALAAKGYGSWSDLNASLHTLQYYGAGAGRLGGGTAYWGGMQDNGTSVLTGAGARQMIEPAGGDGGLVLVDPANGLHAVGEYTDLDMYLTADGGHSFRDISPTCEWKPGLPACDPGARFIAPFVADVAHPTHWTAAGNDVWDDTAGWATTCTATHCDWTAVHSLGTDAGGGLNLATALATDGPVTYAAWVGNGGNPGPAFASGIDTNYGGSWHRITAPNLPQRYVAGLQVDRADPAHVYAIYNGYSRRWIPGGGVGHVFESRNGGATWTDISGNLPDVAADDLVLVSGRLVLATDVGVFAAAASAPTRWSRLGGLPDTSVNDLSLSPDGREVIAATHGRGLWTLRVP